MGTYPPDRPRRAFALVVLSSACFAAMFAVVKLLPATIGSSEILFLRGCIGVAGSAAVLAWRREPLAPGPWSTNLIRSATGVASVLCQYYAIHEAGTEIATANLLTQSAPLWILFLSVPLLGEAPPARTRPALVLGLIGTALTLGPTGAGQRLGLILALISGAFSALALLSVRKLVARENAASVVLFFMAFAAVVSAPLALRGAWLRGGWSLGELTTLLWIGVFGTAGQLFMTQAYRYGSAASVSIAGLMQVAFAALFSFAWLGSPAPSPYALLGGVLILGAGLWALSPWNSAAGAAGPDPRAPSR